MVPNARFKELLHDIEPKPNIKRAASAAHISIRDFLGAHPKFSERLNYDFLAGSYARHTAIRPSDAGKKKSRPDVDVYLQMRYRFATNAGSVLKNLHDVLGNKYGDSVTRNRRSVRISTALLDVDVVPLINSGDGFKIPDRTKKEWIQTNPLFHFYWSRDINKQFGKRFKPLVKLIKWWRREHFDSKRPKGFSLEILAAQCAPRRKKHYGELFTKFLENLLDEYGPKPGWDGKPTLDDPAVLGNDILSRVSLNDWTSFMRLVKNHAKIARQAQKTGDKHEAMQLWRQVLGERFGRGFTLRRNLPTQLPR